MFKWERQKGMNTSRSTPSSPVATANNDVKFKHAFSGISVWLEPDSTQTSALTEEMESLMHKCGGHDAGMHRFVPHCTLLYNTSFPSEENPRDDMHHQQEEDTSRQGQQQQAGEELLTKCLAEYTNHSSERFFNVRSAIQLIPTSHHYFPYPKTADNGRGFGCAISLLMLETTSDLQLLHEVVKKIFPPDERHGRTATNEDDVNLRDDTTTPPTREQESGGGVRQTAAANKKPSFRPHIALVYAPEHHENVTNGWLEKYTAQMECEKRYLLWTRNSSWDTKYLSIWCTEGTLDEWFPIAKLDLSPETCR